MGKPLHRRVVPESFVQLVYEYLDARGHSPEVVLGEPWPATQGGGVAVERWAGMLDRASQHLGDPLLGLNLGQTITPRHLGVLGYVLLACHNLAAALERLERYQRLVFDVIPMTSRPGPGWVELVWDSSQFHPGRLVGENGLTVVTAFCRSMVRTPVSPLLVHFTSPGPADVRPYEDYFRCPVLFGQPEALLRVSLETLALPLKSPDAGLIAVMERHADQLLEQLPQEDAVVEQVRKATAYLLHAGEPDIEAVSAQLCCASRTLQRRLKAAGTGFREELGLVRRELADSYLRDPGLQIVDIALLLGYSEHSAFTRAYREWTGMTPQQGREKIITH